PRPCTAFTNARAASSGRPTTRCYGSARVCGRAARATQGRTASMAHPVTHFEVNARDAKAAQKFYGDLFGWKIDTNNPMDYGMVSAAGPGKRICVRMGGRQTRRPW